MVEVFLSVERLSAGQMELKQESIAAGGMVATCVDARAPLAERKHIAITLEPIQMELEITGDRELMEYACYNLLTNAVKYSPQRTILTVAGWRDRGQIRIAVKKLYTALEDYKLDIIIGQGPAAWMHVMEIRPFTFIGATRSPGLLS